MPGPAVKGERWGAWTRMWSRDVGGAQSSGSEMEQEVRGGREKRNPHIHSLIIHSPK